MKKPNPKFRWHVTAEEKEKIRRMTLDGVRQSVIARELKIGAPSVSKVQREMRLATRLPVPPVPEKKIMELFEKGWGGYKIARHLGLSAPKVYGVAHKNNFRRADGAGDPTPKGDVAGFIDAVKRSENYIKVLAKKYGVGFCQARKIAHEVRACPEFRRGLAWPPLSSNLPMKHFDPKMGTPDIFVQLIDRVFGDKLPFGKEFDVLAVAAMLAGFLRVVPDFRGQPPEVLHSFARGLAEAITCVREAQRQSN